VGWAFPVHPNLNLMMTIATMVMDDGDDNDDDDDDDDDDDGINCVLGFPRAPKLELDDDNSNDGDG
jgi:hypothetical protein